MMIQSFEIPFRLPGLNEINRSNRTSRYVGAKLKSETDTALAYVIAGAKIQPVQQPCIVHMVFCEPNKRRDADNVESAKKFILDALVRCGVLQNDTPRHVVGSPSFTRYVEDGARVVVTIIESADAEELRKRLRNASDVIVEGENHG